MTDRPRPLQEIPETARRVFRGRLFDVYQWEQLLYDGTTDIFEAVKRPDTVYVIPVQSDGKLVIAWQRQPPSEKRLYGLIGGRVEPGEAPVAAAMRELREEAGLIGNEIRLWETFQFLPKVDWAVFIFIARGCVQAPRSPDPGEDIELVEVSFEEILDLAKSEDFIDVEVALRLLRIAANPTELADAESLFLPLPEIVS